MTDSGDAPFYIELAWNWLKKGVYGAVVEGHLMPLDTRVPGYPAFLAAIFSVAGNSSRAVMFTQAVVDLATCFVVALIAARLASGGVAPPGRAGGSVARGALPVYGELHRGGIDRDAGHVPDRAGDFASGRSPGARNERLLLFSAEAGLVRGFLGGVVAGFGALVRPETPLLLLAMGLVLVAKWWRPVNWAKLARAGVLMGIGLLLPLLPWAARNWRTLHEVQFLTPRYIQMPDDFAPLGFNAWTDTWLWRFRDVYLTLWKLNSEEIPIGSIPAEAFDSAAGARASG